MCKSQHYIFFSINSIHEGILITFQYIISKQKIYLMSQAILMRIFNLIVWVDVKHCYRVNPVFILFFCKSDFVFVPLFMLEPHGRLPLITLDWWWIEVHILTVWFAARNHKLQLVIWRIHMQCRHTSEVSIAIALILDMTSNHKQLKTLFILVPKTHFSTSVRRTLEKQSALREVFWKNERQKEPMQRCWLPMLFLKT